MDTLDRRLKQKLPSLTGSQRRLVDYILSHDEESIFHTVRDLAKKSNVSEATVVRLSKALGFSGFPEFQRELRLRFKNRLKTTSRLQKTVKKVAHEGDLLAKILQTDMVNIQETLQQIHIEEFRESVKAMDSAQRIVIIGLRGAYALAFFLGMALEFLQKRVWVVQLGIGDMWDRLLGLEKGDLVVAVRARWRGEAPLICLDVAAWTPAERAVLDGWLAGDRPLPMRRSHEYAGYIIDSLVTGMPRRFNLNVRNDDLITNLRTGCCVEVPCLVDGTGVHPCHVGELPPQCAALDRDNINVQELAVEAALTGSVRAVRQALGVDPLTSALRRPREIRQMADEMLAAEREWLPQFHERVLVP